MFCLPSFERGRLASGCGTRAIHRSLGGGHPYGPSERSFSRVSDLDQEAAKQNIPIQGIFLDCAVGCDWGMRCQIGCHFGFAAVRNGSLVWFKRACRFCWMRWIGGDVCLGFVVTWRANDVDEAGVGA